MSETIQRTDVLPFGGDPSGIADSTTAFRDAILYLKQHRGGVLHIPCGTYLLNSSSNSPALVINSPNISIVGDNQGCVNLQYKGSGTALQFQMSPFTISPAGELKNFTVIGTPNGKAGIKTGGVIGATFENIDIHGFTNGTGFEINDDKSLLPPKGAWTERNTWIKVSEWQNKIGWHLQSPLKPDNYSFGYNEFVSLYMNVSTDQVGFWLDKDSYLYNGYFRATCNADNEQPGHNGPICLRVSGNWKNETISLTGEYGPAPGKPKLEAYSLQIDQSGEMTGAGNISVFGATVNNLRAASFTPTARLNSTLQTWDSGVFNLSGIPTSPQLAIAGRAGAAGVLIGTNIESPFVSMYKFSGNKFIVGSVAYDQPIGAMTPIWSVDDAGNVAVSSNEHVKGTSTVEGGLQLLTHGARPACSPATRGQLWESLGSGDQEDDHLDICQRRNGKYQWVSH